MTTEEARAALEELQGHCHTICCEIARPANRHRKTLSGDNFYGKRFHKAVLALSAAEPKLDLKQA
jgi:hypothetical protein